MSLAVDGGPALSGHNQLEAEAYEKIEAVIPKNSVVTTVKVQPSVLSKLKAIIIISDNYNDLTFTVDSGVTEFTLSAPLLLVGPGLIGMLGETVNDLKFTNANATTDANVTILVARTAV